MCSYPLPSLLLTHQKVKCVVQFKGREMQHRELGQALILRLFESLGGIATMDGQPKMEGRSITVLISPKKENKT